MKLLPVLLMAFCAASLQAALSNVRVTPSNIPAFKGKVTFNATALREALAELRITPAKPLNVEDRIAFVVATVSCVADGTSETESLSLSVKGAIESITVGDRSGTPAGNGAFTFALPVKEGENTFDVRVKLADNASVRDKLVIEGFPVYIGSIVTKSNLKIDGERACGYFRIPGIVRTTKGNLIAIFDNRYNHAGDLPADITVGASISSDNGNTWSPIKTILDYKGKDIAGNDLTGGQGVGDVAILVDPSNGWIWVLGMRSPNSGLPIQTSKTGTLAPSNLGQLYLTCSKDEGQTWSAPRNITAAVKRLGDPDTQGWGLIFQGPGAGIAMANGTLVFPAQIWGDTPGAALIYSKDHGQTWTSSKAFKEGGSESTVAQLPNGDLLLNTRDAKGSEGKLGQIGFRATGLTRDLGETWETLETTPLRQPWGCQGALLSLGDDLYFSNPNASRARDHMSLRVSSDGGKSWNEGLVYDIRKCAGYSSICPIDDRTIGVLYEGNCDFLYFLAIPIADVKAGRILMPSP